MECPYAVWQGRAVDMALRRLSSPRVEPWAVDQTLQWSQRVLQHHQQTILINLYCIDFIVLADERILDLGAVSTRHSNTMTCLGSVHLKSVGGGRKTGGGGPCKFRIGFGGGAK